MSLTLLVTAQPRNAAGQLVDVALAGGGSRAYTHLGRVDWLAGVVAPPRFTAAIGFDETGWTGGTVPQTASLQFAPARVSTYSRLAGLVWRGARITIQAGDDAADPATFSTILVGTVASHSADTGTISFTVTDRSKDLAVVLAKDRFAGTGGAEGQPEAKGRVKRRTWGRAFNVEGRVFDKANNLYEFGDPMQPLQGFDQLKDKGRFASSITVVAWAGSFAQTLAALIATTAPGGGGAVAPSIALAKWWTTPAGPLTADIRGEVGTGYVETAPAIAARILAARSDMTIANLAEGIGIRGAVAGFHADSEAETVAEALDRLLLGVSLLWLVEPAGTIRLRQFVNGASRFPVPWAQTNPAPLTWANTSPAAIVWAPDGSAPERIVSREVNRLEVLSPIKSRRLGYQRNHRVHTDADISVALTGATASLSKPAVVLPADADGNVASFATATGQVSVRSLDGADITSAATFSIPSNGQTNLTGSVTAAGVYSVTALANDVGTLRIAVSYGGNTYPLDFVVAKAKTGAQGEPGEPGDPGAPGKPYIAPATGLSIVNSGAGLRTSFTHSATAGIAGARIYKTQNNSNFSAASPIAFVAGTTGAAGSYNDGAIGPGPTYYYWVVAEDSAGNQSPVAGPVSGSV